MAKKAPKVVENKFVFDSLEEAKASGNGDDKVRLFRVSRPGSGEDAYVWSTSCQVAVVQVAQHDGYRANVTDPKRRIGKSFDKILERAKTDPEVRRRMLEALGVE